MHNFVQVPADARRGYLIPGAGVAFGCEPLNVGAGTAEPLPSPTFILLILYLCILVPSSSFNCILMDIYHYVADV